MNASWARLLLAMALFLGWIGYLGYLVAGRPRTPEDQPLVLSRAQLLASRVDIIAAVSDDPEKPVRIVEVLWRDEPAVAATVAEWPALKGMLENGRELKVENIARSRARAAGPEAVDPASDFTGAGEYLIPLSIHPRSKSISVAQVPESPGFTAPPPTEEEVRENRPVRSAWFEKTTRWPVYRIYPATEEARAQYHLFRPAP